LCAGACASIKVPNADLLLCLHNFCPFKQNKNKQHRGKKENKMLTAKIISLFLWQQRQLQQQCVHFHKLQLAASC